MRIRVLFYSLGVTTSLLRCLLVLILLMVVSFPAFGQSVYVPGQWYDADKYNDNGYGRTKNYWCSYNPLLYDAGENPIRAGWMPGCSYNDNLPCDIDRNYAADPGEVWQTYQTGATVSGMFVLPCYWYDIDLDGEFTDADPHFFQLEFDKNGDFIQDPTENWNVWRVSDDGSCWIATASNIVQSVSGKNRYHEMAYVDGVYYYDWSEMENKTHYWDNAGRTQKAVESCGYFEAFTSANYYETSVVWDSSPVPWIRANLEAGLPVGLGVRWDDESGHAFTVYGIDEAAQTILIADSDSDRDDDQFYEIPYRWDNDNSNKFQIDWDNNGRYYSVGACTSIANSYNIASGEFSWFDEGVFSPHTPSELNNIVVFLGESQPCVTNITAAPPLTPSRTAHAARVTVFGGSELNIVEDGALETDTFHNRSQGHVNIDDGSLTVSQDVVNDGLMDVRSGSLVQIAGRLTIGDQAQGRMVVHGGFVTADTLYLGYDATKQGGLDIAQGTFTGEHDGTLVQNDGTMMFANSFVGHTGTGALELFGGNHQVLGEMIVGAEDGSEGTVRNEGGALTVAQLLVGRRGRGTVVLNGGYTFVQQDVIAGEDAANPLTQQLSMDNLGTTLTVGGNEYLGYAGRARFTQNGGVHGVGGSLVLGYQAGSYGDYGLNGGRLLAASLVVGQGAEGFFSHNGGTNEAEEILLAYEQDVLGRYDMNGGAILADTMTVGYNGMGQLNLNGTDAINIQFAQNFYVGRYSTAQGMVLMNNPNATLTVAGDEDVGPYGRGVFIQKSGVHSVTGELRLGRDSTGEGGTYTMEGGSLDAGTLAVGLWGVGRFTHDQGEVRTNSMFVGKYQGEGSTGDGAYTMRGQLGDVSLTVTNDEVIGGGGLGVFEQFTGDHVVGGTLALGAAATGNGSYTMHSGTLTAGALAVGVEGIGAFRQQDGTVTAGTLSLGVLAGSDGQYAMENGLLSAVNVQIGTGEGTSLFEQQSGRFEVSESMIVGGGSLAYPQYHLINGELAAENATIFVKMRGKFLTDAGSVVADALQLEAGAQFDAGLADWTLNQLTFPASWGSLSFSTLRVGHAGGAGVGDVTVPTAFQLTTTQDLHCGYQAAGTIRQASGSLVTTPSLYVGESEAGGTYRMEGPTSRLIADDIRVGAGGQGTFEQLSLTSRVEVSGTLAVGYSGGDEFSVDPVGVYTMAGGILTTQYLNIGVDANGRFTQNGGTNQTEALSLGTSSRFGEYYLNGGELHAPLMYVGDQSGGGMTVNGGSVETSAMYVGGASYGYLTISQGQVQARDLLVACGNEVQGDVELSGSGVLNTDTTRVGIAGGGRFTQSGGSHIVRDDLKVGEGYPYEMGNNYTLSGGLVTSTRTYVGLGGSGLFEQTGGEHTISDSLWIGATQDDRPGHGYYSMRGGVLSAPAIHIEGRQENAILAYYGGEMTTHEVTVTGQYAAMAFENNWSCSNASVTISDGGTFHGNAYEIAFHSSQIELRGGYLYGDVIDLLSDEGATSVLQGNGCLDYMSEFVNEGRVIADGGILDMSQVGDAFNNNDNPGDWGWYAQNGGAILLPERTVTKYQYNIPWSGSLTFGDDSYDHDLVNSVNIWLWGARVQTDRQFGATVLAPDADVPDGLVGTVMGLWALTAPNGMTFDEANIDFRYDDSLIADLGWDYDDYVNNIRLYQYNGLEWIDVTDFIDPEGRYAVAVPVTTLYSLYAVTYTPEPATMLLLTLGLGAMLRRRQRVR